MGHQIATRPAVRAVDRHAELFVGQVGEGLIRRPRIAFLLEELHRVEVHGRDGRPGGVVSGRQRAGRRVDTLRTT